MADFQRDDREHRGHLHARQRLLRVKDVAKVELFGVQDEKIFVEISQKRLAQLGLDMNQVIGQLGAQNAVESAGAVQTPLDVVQVRASNSISWPWLG